MKIKIIINYFYDFKDSYKNNVAIFLNFYSREYKNLCTNIFDNNIK